ncbi:hypothetical protein niasHS_003529 [Heterodera schachtii]|uniref:Uncharacterized protein n=1 Tax=Heterodera schachtii TaxID=97005 RepID=A0ABD2KGR5_HETSC
MSTNYNNNQQQQSVSIRSYQNQMQSVPVPIQHSETETNFYFQQESQFTGSQGPQTIEPNGNIKNGFLQENDVTLQRQQQQMAVSSPSDCNVGLGNGQNGMRYGFFAGSQQSDPSSFLLQQTTVEEGVSNGDICHNAQRHQLQFSTMNGQIINGQNGGMCFPSNLPSAMSMLANAPQRRTFLFNSDMANTAAKSMQQHLTEDMAGWHLQHCPVAPSTSRAAFEQKRTTINSSNNNINNQAPRTTNGRGTKRKASAAHSMSDTQQTHSMSLSPRDIRPPSYTSSIGHPQSAPVMSNQTDQSQHCNELCDSSTNSDVDMFKGSSGHLQQSNGALSNYIQNGSVGQMDENPLKKMEIMTSKTLNEPTSFNVNGRVHRPEDGAEQNHQTMQGAVDASKQEKMHKLQEIEKALLPFADTSPSYPNAAPFPDSTNNFRPHFFAPHGQMIQTPHAHFCAIRPLMGSFPQNHPLKMGQMNTNQQMYNSIGEQRTVMQGMTDGVVMTADETEISQQTWRPQ